MDCNLAVSWRDERDSVLCSFISRSPRDNARPALSLMYAQFIDSFPHVIY